VRSFIWKVRLNRIPSKSALFRRGVDVSFVECSLCTCTRETSDHVLLHCHFAAVVCARIFKWCGWSFHMESSIRECIDSYTSLNGSNSMKEVASGILMVTTWAIWSARNDLIFNAITPSIDGVVEKIMINSFIWLKHWAKG